MAISGLFHTGCPAQHKYKNLFPFLTRQIIRFCCKLSSGAGLCTMCDFHNFGLIFAGQMHCLPQRLKSMLFEIFSNGGCPKGTRSVEKISNNVDFSLWGNRATTWEYFLTFSSETKIMKITHSAGVYENYCWNNALCKLLL